MQPLRFNLLKTSYIFAFIVLLGAVLRFFNVSSVPPSLNWDEVSHAYNAYSILKTGSDEWGEFLPIIFRAYGDYKLPVYIYLTTVSELFFGLSVFAVRLPSILAGIGTIVFTYFLTIEIFRPKISNNTASGNYYHFALVAALLVAVEPWPLFISRGAFEANLALLFFTAGAYFFLKALNNLNSASYILLSTVLFGLTMWTYNSYRIFTPLMFTALTVVYWVDLKKLYKTQKSLFFNSLVTILIFLLPMFYQIFTGVGQARYGEVKIIDQGMIARIEEQRNLGGTRLVHNKFTYFSKQFFINYFSHFNPRFLALEGGNHYQFSLPGRGVLYLVNLFFFYIGIVFVARKALKSNHDNLLGSGNRWLILIWLILAPIPSSLTREAPHVLRAITILPLPMIFSSLGLFGILELMQKRWSQLPVLHHLSKTIYISTIVCVGYLVLLTESINKYLNEYSTEYPTKYSQAWQYGYKEVVEYARQNYSNYDNIIVTKKYGEPHEFLLYYWPWDPTAYRKDPKLIRFYQSNWYWVDRFDKFYFVNDWDIPKEEWQAIKLESGGVVDCSASRCLLISSPNNYPKTWSKVNTINFLDGSPAFEFYVN